VAAVQWEIVPLGDVAELDIERITVEPDAEYRLVGVLIAGHGLFWRDTILGSKTTYPTLHQLRAGQLVMRKLTAWEGPITTVQAEFDGGYVSSEFPTFRLDESRLLPEYMRLICQRPRFHAEMRLRSTGTPERRNRLKPEDLLSIEIDLPPIEEQHLIVDAAAASDAVCHALTQEEAALAALLLAGHRQAFESLPDEPRRLEEVTSIVSGGTPARTHPEYFGGEIAWVKSGDIVFRDVYETPERITADGLASSAAKMLPAKTVVVAMYGQGATRGRCAVLQAPMATNQACAGILPSPDLDERFLFHWMWSQYEALREDSEGTSQLNLSKGVIQSLEIPVPPIEQQNKIAAQLDAILDRLIRVQVERTLAEDLRSVLLDALLSGLRQVLAHPRTVKEPATA
jgi:type I restriction enzyme S subunit